MKTPYKPKSLMLVPWILMISFTFARLVMLNADFPAEIGNWSSDLYTDEGWYSNSAARKIITGNWILPGDFNPIINMPIFQVTQFIVFKVFGLGLVQARIGEFFWFLLLQTGLFLFVKRLSTQSAALTTLLFIAFDPFIFAYSRLAFLEIPMTAIVIITMLSIVLHKPSYTPVYFILSGLIFGVSMLVKTSAIFALPLALLMISLTTKSKKILNCIAFIIGWLVLFAGYTFWAKSTFPADFSYFQRLNYSQRLDIAPVSLLLNFTKVITSKFLTNNPIIWVVLIFILILLYTKLRKTLLFKFYVIWLILCIGILSVSYYQPGRYFIPLLVGACGFVAFAFTELININKGIVKKLLFALVFVLLGYHSTIVGKWLDNPTYTYQTMVDQIETRIKSEKVNNEIVILGHLANSIGIELKVLTINDTYGTEDIQLKIRRYHPNFYISLGELVDYKEITDVLAANYSIRLIESFDVFNNYYGEKVFFYRLHDKISTDSSTVMP